MICCFGCEPIVAGNYAIPGRTQKTAKVINGSVNFLLSSSKADFGSEIALIEQRCV
jgi:hypothetical protein